MTRRTAWIILGITAFLTTLAVWRVTTLRPESSLDGLLNPNDPATAAMGRVLRDFPVAEEMLVLASLPDGDADAGRLTAFAERLTAELQASPHLVTATRYRAGDSARDFVQRVMGPAGLLYLNDEQLAAARQRLTPEGMREQLARSAAMLAAPGPAAGGLAKAMGQDPLRLHEFLLASLKDGGLPASAATGGDTFATADGRGLLVRIEGAKPPGDLAFSAELTDAVRAAAAKANTDGLTLAFSGAYAIAAHNAAAIRGDAIESTVVSSIALALLFGLLYRRSVRTFLLAFGPVVMGLVWGFGLYACFRDTITPLAATIGGVLGGVGIDYPVHLMAHRRENETPGGTVRRLRAPLIAALLTSVVGFAAVAWSPLRVLRDFSLLGTLGLCGAWTATVVVLPALLALVGEHGVGAAATRGGPAARLWPVVSKRPAVFARVGLGVVIAASVAAVFAARGLQEDSDLTGLHPRPNPPLDALAEIDRRMAGGGGSFVVLLTARDDDELLVRAWQVRRALAGSGVRAFGPASLLPDPARVRSLSRYSGGGLGRGPGVDGAPDARAPSLTLPREYAGEGTSMPQGRFVASRPDEEIDADRVVADFKAVVADSDFDPHAFDAYAGFLPKLLRPTTVPTISDLRQYPDLSQAVLPKRTESPAAIIVLSPKQPADSSTAVQSVIDDVRIRLANVNGATLTGMAVLASDTRHAARRDSTRIALTAAAAVTLTLMLHLRSVPLAVLTVLPTLFSFACVLVAMRAFGFGVNVVNLVLFPLLLGITVDYGIFVTDVLRRGVTDTPPERFLAATTALLTCVATTFIGFGSLVTTHVPAVRSLGWLINVGLVACVVGAVFILWPVVLVIARRKGRG